MPRTRLSAGFLIVAVLALGVTGAEFLVHLRSFLPGNDDALSLALSSCHLQEAQALRSPDVRWPIQAKDLVRLMEAPERLALPKVLSDIYALDIHPPLYFLLLHIWQWIFGGNVTTAILLSVFTACLSACILYVILARRVGPPAATLFTALFVLSPGYHQAALTARQYTLAACFAILLAGCVSERLQDSSDRSGRSVFGLIAVGSLMALTAHQTVPLAVSLLGGWMVTLAMWRRHGDQTAIFRAALGLAAAYVPIVLLARWQGRNAGATGAGGFLFPHPEGSVEMLKSGLQAFLSLFLDAPYSFLPLSVRLVAACLFILVALVLLTDAPPLSRGAGLFIISVIIGCTLYAGLILLYLFPPRLTAYYFVPFAGAYVLLLAASLPADPGRGQRALGTLTVLVALSGAMFSARLVRYALTEGPRDRGAFALLKSSTLILTDAIEPGHFLRLADRLPGNAEVWALHLPIDDAACRSIARSTHGRRAVLARLGVADPLQLETAVRKCTGGSLPTRRVQAGWLDLELWEPAPSATPR